MAIFCPFIGKYLIIESINPAYSGKCWLSNVGSPDGIIVIWFPLRVTLVLNLNSGPSIHRAVADVRDLIMLAGVRVISELMSVTAFPDLKSSIYIAIALAFSPLIPKCFSGELFSTINVNAIKNMRGICLNVIWCVNFKRK